MAEVLAGDEVADGTMYYVFLKPEFASQYPMPGKKADAAKPADKGGNDKPAKAKTQKGLKQPANPQDANK